MLTVTAAQHIFSHVPAEQSPQKRRGFQTLMRTPALTPDLVRAIENHALYPASPENPTKRQFYALPGQLAAVAQSVALPEPDEFGRKGRYLTHTLVFDAATFAQLGACPLDVFAQFRFAATLAEVFAQGRVGHADIPPVQITLEPQWEARAMQLAQTWPGDRLSQLGRLAWLASTLQAQRQSVYLAGDAAAQLEALSVCFLLAAPRQRFDLSFDTHALGCEWPRDVTFWAQGYAALPETPVPHLVDVTRKQITTRFGPRDDTPFAVWMLNELTARRLRTNQQEQTWALQLDMCLHGAEGDRPPFDASMSDAFVSRFAQLNAAAVAARWLVQAPAGLSSSLLQTLLQQAAAQAPRLLSVLRERAHISDCQEFVFQTLLDLRLTLSAADRQVLTRWLTAAPHPGLSALLSFLAQDDKAYAQNLLTLKIEDYQYIIERTAAWPQPPVPLWKALVRQPAPVWQRLSPQPPTQDESDKAEIWIRIAARYVGAEDREKALPALARLGDDTTDLLAAVVGEFNAYARFYLGRTLSESKIPAPALRAAVGLAKPPALMAAPEQPASRRK